MFEPVVTAAGNQDLPPSGVDASAVVDLAERHSNDLEVVLLWSRCSGRFWVRVTDRASGRTSHIDAQPHNALDVFHHPFAYAA